MNRIFKFLILLLGLLLVTVGCIQNLPYQPTGIDDADVIVKCVLTPTNEQKVELMYSAKDENGNLLPVTEAQVILSHDEGQKVFSKRQDGLWSAYYKPEYNMQYRLTVIMPGRDTIYAQTQMSRKKSVAFTDTHYANPKSSVYYNWSPYGAKGYLEDFLGGTLFLVRDEENGRYSFGNIDCLIWIVADNGARLGTNHLFVDKYNQSDSLRFDSSRIYDEKSYKYSQYQYLDGSLLHSGPLRIHHRGDVNVNGVPEYTIDKGTMSTGLLPDDYNPLEAIKESNDRARTFFSVFGEFSYPAWEKWHPGEVAPKVAPKGKLYFYFFSDELDKYYKSVEQYTLNSRTDLLDMLYSDETESVYTNIINGYGIFGAAQCLYFDFESESQRVEMSSVFLHDDTIVGYLFNFFDV